MCIRDRYQRRVREGRELLFSQTAKMLTYLLRNAQIVMRHWRKPMHHPLQKHTTKLRVRLFDLDYNFHMNNSRFLEALEMGRMAWSTQTGFLSLLVKNRWMPLVASAHVIYLHSLHYPEKYHVDVKIDGWDEKWIFISQKIVRERDSKDCCVALMKVAVKGKKGLISPSELVKLLAPDHATQPELMVQEYHTILKDNEKQYGTMIQKM
eukprot:TRINITY_DN25_c0_g1_i1.p1 TRINITY_DN25_c0_g1~~TRINITY_DN25_c0_g1_i1.p1  ORF type:complete len:208 (+),score=43.53 TRINITY_DN25_c0_g1_i1:24-647(+)